MIAFLLLLVHFIPNSFSHTLYNIKRTIITHCVVNNYDELILFVAIKTLNYINKITITDYALWKRMGNESNKKLCDVRACSRRGIRAKATIHTFGPTLNLIEAIKFYKKR